MPILEKILSAVTVVRLIGPNDVVVKGLTFNSRQAGPDMAFFAIPGAVPDAHTYIPQAVDAGSPVIIC